MLTAVNPHLALTPTAQHSMSLLLEGITIENETIVTQKDSDGSKGTLLVSCDLPGAPADVFEGVTPTKGFVAYWNRIAPAGADNRTLFHVLPHGGDHD
jgi:hypothetical protein